MLFNLKKFIGAILMPLPALLLLMGLALLLLWFTRWQKSGKVILTLSWLFLLLFSLQPVADRLLRPIESEYVTYRGTDPVNYIVVLGGGYTFNPGNGTLPTYGPLFIGLLIGTVLLVGALTFVPALALGPVAEHLQLWLTK